MQRWCSSLWQSANHLWSDVPFGSYLHLRRYEEYTLKQRSVAEDRAATGAYSWE